MEYIKISAIEVERGRKKYVIDWQWDTVCRQSYTHSYIHTYIHTYIFFTSHTYIHTFFLHHIHTYIHTYSDEYVTPVQHYSSLVTLPMVICCYFNDCHTGKGKGTWRGGGRRVKGLEGRGEAVTFIESVKIWFFFLHNSCFFLISILIYCYWNFLGGRVVHAFLFFFLSIYLSFSLSLSQYSVLPHLPILPFLFLYFPESHLKIYSYFFVSKPFFNFPHSNLLSSPLSHSPL